VRPSGLAGPVTLQPLTDGVKDASPP
jgi:hypothetical protein